MLKILAEAHNNELREKKVMERKENIQQKRILKGLKMVIYVLLIVL